MGSDVGAGREQLAWLRASARLGSRAMLWAFVAAIVVALASPLIAMAFGCRVFVVTSGSMRPTAEAGDAILLERVDAGRVRIGDVVTFRPLRGGGVRTHRVMSIHDVDGAGTHLRTKGDGNTSFDPDLVPAANVLGRVRLVLPRIGRGYLWATTVWGRVVLVGIPAIAIAAAEVRSLLEPWRAGRPRHRRIVRRRAASIAVATIALIAVSGPTAARFADAATAGSNTIASGQLLPPTNLNASAQLIPCRVNLSWTAPATGVSPDGYDILRSTTSGGPYTLRKHVGAVTSAADDSGPLAAATTYYYVVRSTRGGWTSANSAQRSVTTLLCVL